MTQHISDERYIGKGDNLKKGLRRGLPIRTPLPSVAVNLGCSSTFGHFVSELDSEGLNLRHQR